MHAFYLFLVILLPFIGGILTKMIRWKKRAHMLFFIESFVIATSALVWTLLFHRPEEAFTLVNFTGNLAIAFRLDGAGCVFAGLVSFLWPLATLYAFEYMTKEEHEKVFFLFYTVTYGVTLGIALAGNILTMYCFYEMLTLVTVPLVMHTLTREAILASRKYLYYSIGGAAFAFIGMIFVIIYGDSLQFSLGGILNPAMAEGQRNMFLLIYVFSFFGFGVKAAICPLNSWLPQAGVAPTPVTALLHAVAVVKSGAFAIIRLTFYCFGTGFLRGTWAQGLVMAATMVTIVYGCGMALKETHFKRRLAYSTISNLSYILFGVTIMTPAGLVGAFCHMVCHAFMKICSFFCAGAVMHQTDRHYIHQLDGFGKKMPKVFAAFTVSALALMGVPGLCGFISKYGLVSAAIESGNTLSYFGIAALLVSALLTAMYMLGIVVRAYFPKADFDYRAISDVKDPNWMMILPLVVFVAAIAALGLHPQPLLDVFTEIAAGNF